MKRCLIILFLLILCICVKAEDIVINIPRNNYRIHETFQAEIFFNVNPIQVSVSNFELTDMNNNKIATPLFLEKINNYYYFVYFDLPDVGKGQYKFRVKNINYVQNNILRETSNYKTINIDKINNGFSYLVNQQNTDGSFDTIKETALAALALKNTYSDNAENAINYLLNNQDATGCYPKNNCNIEDTSFALLALYSFNKNIIKTKNWLKDASNNFNLGTWNLILNAVNSNCSVNEQGFTFNPEVNILLSNKNILVNCTNNVSLKLLHSYLGNNYQIFYENTKYKNYSIDDSECYGYYYKSSCNYQSTGYSDWVLKQTGENPSLIWYENNQQDTETLYYALLYLIDEDDYAFDWLMNNLQINYWSDKSASLNQEPNNYASTFSSYALKDNNVYYDVKNYLKDKTETNVLDSALILYFLFNDERNLPSVSIYPGIVNKLNSFSLIINNNNEPLNIQIIAPNFTNLPSSVLLENELYYNIDVEESFNIEIIYGNDSYLIPVLSESYVSEDITEPLILLPPAKESIEILDVDEIINKTLNYDDKIKDSIYFKNNWGFSLHNISLTLTGDLNEIIRLDRNNYDEIEPNETIEEEMIINEYKNPENEYSGYLIITSQEGTFVSLPIILYFTSNKASEDSFLEDTEEEIIDDGSEGNKTKPSPDNKEKKSKKWLWIIPIIFILIIGLIILYLNSRKKEVKSFDDYIKRIKR